MANDTKLISAREAAQAVLNKAKEILKDSSLMKSENLAKYETENHKAPGVKYGKIETAQKPTERDYTEYNVKSGNSKDSTGKRLTNQISPSKNPKEEAEGNNQPDGAEPPYEFKDKIPKELAKEKAALGKNENLAKGDWNKIHNKLKREGYSEKSADKIDGAIKAKMGKNENPDEKEDAKLGEKVEHDVEEHMSNNADAERQEGHKSMDKPEGTDDKAFMPARLIASAKLSKFMEHKHAKRKAAEAQSTQAVGHDATNAPPARSTQAGEPEKK